MIVQLIKAFFTGMLVSFLGQLPLGNVNITATQLTVQENNRNAWKFAFGLAVVEVAYVRLVLTGLDWVLANKTVFKIIGGVSVILFLVLGVASLWSAQKQGAEKKGLLLNNTLDRFLLGVSISAVNPVQIPFWFTWSLYLVNGNWLHPIASEYNLFTAGAGVGTLIGLAVYIYGGKWAIKKLNANNRSINRFMGAVFILVALLQWYKLIYDPWINTLK